MPEFQAPVGTFDVLPPESWRYQALVARFADHVGRAGYGLVITPLFEEVGVFERVGQSTDIVRKEMYDFEDKGGRRLALRPESTAGVARAFVQRRPGVPFKSWYVAAHFRYERPQAGRYRQHHQLGVEALGSEDPDLDAEVVALAWGFYAGLGLTRLRVRLTSLGDAACRPAYREKLLTHLDQRRSELCEEHRQRMADNPLRVLDCKRPACRAVSAEAPRMVEHLCEDCDRHFERVRASLSALGVPFELDSSLVRGLDYYTRTTFELSSDALEFAHSGAGGGGRYDGLVESLGGPPTPGIGFGLGVERALLACDAEGILPAPDSGSTCSWWTPRVDTRRSRSPRSSGGPACAPTAPSTTAPGGHSCAPPCAPEHPWRWRWRTVASASARSARRERRRWSTAAPSSTMWSRG